jgi:hypothetical protein
MISAVPPCFRPPCSCWQSFALSLTSAARNGVSGSLPAWEDTIREDTAGAGKSNIPGRCDAAKPPPSINRHAISCNFMENNALARARAPRQENKSARIATLVCFAIESQGRVSCNANASSRRYQNFEKFHAISG